MANYAIVIGCDEYWNDESDLDGAVNDALAMRSWLLGPGGVDAQNLILLLSPTQRNPAPATLPARPATRANIVQAVTALLNRSDGDDGVLYFYFGGHGLTAHVDGYDEPCLLPADFLPSYRDPALPVRDLRAQLATASLMTQFMFIDACRAVPTDRAFRSQGISDRRPGRYGPAEPDQYVFFAAGAGEVAYETGTGAGPAGTFTAALLRGLGGTGRAKRWDPYDERYVVRVRELFDFVDAELTAAGIGQVPRGLDSYRNPNPVLVDFPETAFEPVGLTVTVTPADAAAMTAIGVLGPEDQISLPPLSNPLALRMAPRTYSVRAHASGFAARRRSWTVDLYDDTDLEVELAPGAGDPAPAWVSRRVIRGFEPCGDADSPVLRPADPLAVVEIADESGAIRHGAGGTRFDRTGRYRLRVLEPHGAGPVRPVEIVRGDRQEIALDPPAAPSELAVRLARGAGLLFEPDGWWTHPRSGRHLAPMPAGTVAGIAALTAPRARRRLRRHGRSRPRNRGRRTSHHRLRPDRDRGRR